MSPPMLEAAALVLSAEGNRHGWFSSSFEALDPIGREEFLDLVARIVSAANSAENKILRETLHDARETVDYYGLDDFESTTAELLFRIDEALRASAQAAQ